MPERKTRRKAQLYAKALVQAIIMKPGDLSTDDMLDRWKGGSTAASGLAIKAARGLNINPDDL